MRASWFWCLCLAGACSAPRALPNPAPLTQGGSLHGEIQDETGGRVAQAEVVVEDSAIRATSDADGLFSLNGLVPGPRWLVIRHAGYEPLRLSAQIEAGKTLALTVPLIALPEPEPASDPQSDPDPTPTSGKSQSS